MNLRIKELTGEERSIFLELNSIEFNAYRDLEVKFYHSDFILKDGEPVLELMKSHGLGGILTIRYPYDKFLYELMDCLSKCSDVIKVWTQNDANVSTIHLVKNELPLLTEFAKPNIITPDQFDLDHDFSFVSFNDMFLFVVDLRPQDFIDGFNIFKDGKDINNRT